MSDEAKKPFIEKANELARLHMNEFPDYKYRPKKKPKKTNLNENSNPENSCKSINKIMNLNKTQKKFFFKIYF